ncbi:hypothetical protein [Methanosphaera sp. BMS]|uniref:hypothetical protein n=1 Tax=Methanosphaera sp. BMS TaxID=1789762 RepID=UPI000DC1C973|nr:hypothetical protein [Methanosphaera sp. BMS]AWX31714.1 hypothetical protein AW729_00810 [Methanosphaera sp. BMS]
MENDPLNKENQTNDSITQDTCILSDDNHKICIYIKYNNTGGNLTEDNLLFLENAENKTINGVEGYLSNVHGTLMFSYLYKGKVVTITGDEDTLSQMIIKQ